MDNRVRMAVIRERASFSPASSRFTNGLTRAGLVAALALAAVIALPAAHPATAGFSGTNGQIVFTDELGSGVLNGNLYVVRPDGTGLREVLRGAAAAGPAWSPDGNAIVFFRRVAPTPPCPPCGWELNVLDPDDGTERKLIEGATFNPAPTWSPDGTKIAFVNQRNGTGDDEIWVMNADGTGARQLTFSVDNFGPAWSPDGTKIAFHGFGPTGVDVYVMNADGTGERALTGSRSPTSDFDVYPSWSPDGRQIAFWSDRDGTFDVHVMNSDGTALRRVTTGARRPCPPDCQLPLPYAPAWSPDGTQVAFQSDRGDRPQIYVMNADGSAVRQVTNSPSGAADPDWQPTVDLAIAGPRAVAARVGRPMIVRFSIRNASPRSASRVTVAVTVRGQAGRVTGATARGACVRAPVVRCVLPTLAGGATATVAITLRPRARGRLLLRANVRAREADPDHASNSAQTRVNVTRSRG